MASSSAPVQTQPQADHLPTKRGEIGYRASLHADTSPQRHSITADLTPHLPARHPADRSRPQSPAPSLARSAEYAPAPYASHPEPPNSLFMRFGSKNRTGVRTSTLIFLVSQFFLSITTIVLWVVAAKFGNMRLRNVAIFIHITFAMVIVCELILLERSWIKFRAEKYASSHPEQFMNSLDHARLPMTPWNRPPLPTYAAVLIESGVNTGDVEDSRIAVPPPPAYGITRGSQLLFAGPPGEEPGDQSRLVREDRGEGLGNFSQGSSARSTSRASHNSEWAVRCDATRAMILEAVLNRSQEEQIEVPQDGRMAPHS